jgi:DtxR family Mn-dependent transcriptional regulator
MSAPPSRDHHLTSSQEDYLEAIWDLVQQDGSARVRDIAERLAVAMPSVTVALKSLAGRGLVEYEPYQQVTLTRRGKGQAERITRRHEVLRDFLTEVLDVDEPVAEANACRLEHAVDDAVLQRLQCFAEFTTGRSAPADDWPGAFRRYCQRRRRRADCPGCDGAGRHHQDTPAS